MDYFMIDLTSIQQKISETNLWNDEIILFGCDKNQKTLSAEKLAKWADTIPWEILTSVGERVPRVFNP